MGMPEAEFWATTPRYFYLRVERWDIGRRDSWEQARMVSFWVVRTVDSKNRFKSYQDLMRFPWEDEVQRFNELTPDDYQRLSDEADAALAQVNPELYARIMAAKAQQQSTNEP